MVEWRAVAIFFHSDDYPHRTINAFSGHFCSRVRAARRSSFSVAAVCSFVAYADTALHHRNGGLLYLCESNLVGNHRYVCHLQLTPIALKGISTQWHLRKLVLQRTATAQCHENSTESSTSPVDHGMQLVCYRQDIPRGSDSAARGHVAASLTAGPFIFTVGRTVVLPPKRPELCGDRARTCSGVVSGFFAASNVAAAAFVRIWRFSDPSEAQASTASGRTNGLN